MGSRRVGAGCRTVVHRLSRSLCPLVLGPPALPFGDGAEQGEGVAGGVGLLIGPDEAGQTVRAEHGGGHPFDLGGDDAGGVEGFADDSGAVGFVFGEGLAGPVAGDEDAAAADAEVLSVVGLARASAGDEAGARLVGLDAVAQPVRTAGRARQPSQLGMQPVDVLLPGGGGVVVAERVGDGFGEVLGQVADGPVRVLGGGDDAGGVLLGAEPQHMHRPGVGVVGDLVERFGPGGQHLPGVGVAVPGPGPDRLAMDIDGPVKRRPPQGRVGRLDHLLEDGPGHDAADGQVQMRRQPGLRFDHGEVLHPEPAAPPEVLDEPVDQLREVQRVGPRRRPIAHQAVRSRAGR